jgi:hypothetical protein
MNALVYVENTEESCCLTQTPNPGIWRDDHPSATSFEQGMILGARGH